MSLEHNLYLRADAVEQRPAPFDHSDIQVERFCQFLFWDAAIERLYEHVMFLDRSQPRRGPQRQNRSWGVIVIEDLLVSGSHPDSKRNIWVSAVKTIAGLTLANERAVKNWFNGINGPSGEFLILLCRRSDMVLETFLMLAGHGELVKVKKFGDVKTKLNEMLLLLGDLVIYGQLTHTWVISAGIFIA